MRDSQAGAFYFVLLPRRGRLVFSFAEEAPTLRVVAARWEGATQARDPTKTYTHLQKANCLPGVYPARLSRSFQCVGSTDDIYRTASVAARSRRSGWTDEAAMEDGARCSL